MAMRLVVFIWALLTPSLRATSEQLFETEEPGTRIFHRCKASNLTLNEPHHDLTLLHVFVFLGRESLASSSVPATGSFENRLIVDNNGRVTLTNLMSDDLGRYRVEVQAEDKITYNIRLTIKEPPKSVDGKLFVMKEALPDRNSIRLMCGTFTTLGFPPVSAVWKDPAGRTLSSDGFKDQYFYLDVPGDTADSGDYCCHLDCRAPDFCCLDDQSPLRSCARIPVQTDRKVEVTTVEKMSLANLTQAMTYLVHRQARCDQLDTYITKVETLEVDMMKGIENMRNTTRATQLYLERETNHKLWNFQLQMDFNISRAMDSCTVSQQQLLTTVSDKLLALEMKFNKDLFEEISEAGNKHQSQINKTITQLEAEGKTGLSGLPQITSDLRIALTTNVQTLTNVTSKTGVQVSELEKKLSDINNMLNRLETNTNKSLEAIRSNMSAIYMATPEGQCLLKTGFVWYQGTCLKVVTRPENYFTAKANCEADGAHLYDVKSPDLDQERVRFVLKPTGVLEGAYIWLGGNDLEVEGDYRWSDGTPLSASSKLWETGQPNNVGGIQDCIRLFVSSIQFVLHDVGCSISYRYICQYDL